MLVQPSPAVKVEDWQYKTYKTYKDKKCTAVRGSPYLGALVQVGGAISVARELLLAGF